MPMKTTKTQGRDTKSGKTELKTKVAARGKGGVNTGQVAKTPAGKPELPPAISTDEIALRAYFNAQQRRDALIPGDDLGDWVEAERQLVAEKAAG